MVNKPNEISLLLSLKHIFILPATQIALDTAQPTACVVIINAEDGKQKIMNQSLRHTKSTFHPARKNKDKSLQIF